MFWFFAACMFCFLLAATRATDLMKPTEGEALPAEGLGYVLFNLAGTIAYIAVVALFVCGFFVVDWWQVLAGTLAAAIAVGVVAAGPVASGSRGWVIALVCGGVFLAAILQESYADPRGNFDRCLRKAATMPTDSGVRTMKEQCILEYRAKQKT